LSWRQASWGSGPEALSFSFFATLMLIAVV
jgi:hypothetical protein